MTPENWIAIGLIVATLISAGATVIAPTISVLVQSRLAKANQEKQEPDTEKKKLSRRARSVLVDYIPWLLTMTSLSLLIREIGKDVPLDRFSVLYIATYVGVICVNVTLFIVERTYIKFLELISKVVDLNEMHVRSTYNLIEKHVDATDALSVKMCEAPPTAGSALEIGNIDKEPEQQISKKTQESKKKTRSAEKRRN